MVGNTGNGAGIRNGGYWMWRAAGFGRLTFGKGTVTQSDSGGSPVGTGTYTIKGNVLTMSFEDRTKTATFSKDGNILILTYENGNKVTLTR